jgi:hypothetical protein
MLDDLETIDWAALRHAYGSAHNVPALLRQLATMPPAGPYIAGDEESELTADTRADEWEAIYGFLCHQGTIYSASAAVVPFLRELLLAPGERDKPGIMGLLCCIAAGGIYHRPDNDWMRRHVEARGADYDALVREALAELAQVEAAVRAGIPDYLRLLDDPNEWIREQAGELLARFPDTAAQSAPTLASRIAVEPEIMVRARLIQALGRITEDQPAAYLPLFQHLLAAEEGVVRFYAAVALVRILGDGVPPAALTVLQAGLQQQCFPPPKVQADEWEMVGQGCDVLPHLGPQLGVPLVAASLADTVGLTPTETLLRTLLELAFGTATPSIQGCVFGGGPDGHQELFFGWADLADSGPLPVEWQGLVRDPLALAPPETGRRRELTDLQRVAVTAILQSPVLRQIRTNLYGFYGLPLTRRELRRLLDETS